MMLVTETEAQRAVEAELKRRNLTKPMTAAEMSAFCQIMYNKLNFSNRTDSISDIRAWAETWQARFLAEQAPALGPA